ncbi:FAD-dependent oxidoreductase [Salinibius halmophilus]|uniref:FAD-dependent oxidoreductase n=1 Tax=Salinibius halmophilus TaxID=1853216 RepID=UPI000E66B3DB|nr:FAD-dependent oxidoreductase [Salinibius halmophilus]
MKLNGSTVAIIGAGLLGRLFAWRLSEAGAVVSVFEKDSEQANTAAAFTAAGMVSPLSEVAVGGKKLFDLGERSLTLWQQWLGEDAEQVEWQANGSLILAHGQDLPLLQQFTRDAEYQGVGQDHWQRLTPIELANIEPQLNNRFANAIYAKGEAALNGRKLLPWLANKLSQVNWHWSTPINDLEALQADFDLVIDCRGKGAKGIRGVRGEVMHVHAPDVTLKHPLRLMHPRYHIYVVPRENHHFVIGATELESEDRGAMTVRSTLELASALYSIHPGFGEGRIVEMDANLRPATPDNMPVVSQQDNLLTVNGLYRHGYLLAPAVIADVLSMVTELQQPWFYKEAL